MSKFELENSATGIAKDRWQFWIDVGGTFTDCLARRPDGKSDYLKILSSGLTKFRGRLVDDNTIEISGSNGSRFPDQFFNGSKLRVHHEPPIKLAASILDFNGSESRITVDGQLDWPSDEFQFEIDPGVAAPIVAVHQLTQVTLSSKLPPVDVFLGTTKGTNALLTRAGARTALVTSIGFKDLLEIGDQARPHLFELTIRKPEMLYEVAVEIEERTLFDGTVELAPDVNQVRRQLTDLKERGIESVAICLMHAYRYPKHEQIVGQLATDLGFVDVRISSDVAPLVKIVPRAQTTVLDAYLNPVISNYLKTIDDQLGSDGQLKLMTSAGSLSPIARFSGKDSVLSGPAAGVVGSARVAEQIGYSKSIGFDMGGTSTDVSRYDGRFALEYESQKAGVTLMTPVMGVETVAAGGGSICGFDGTRLTVGPDSAGSDPGPACYGRQGPLTVTDVNCFLGRIDPARFAFKLDVGAVEFRLRELQKQIAIAGIEKSLEEIATGVLSIANHNMALAIGNVSVRKGYDVRDYPLVSFGGAAGQHCCAVADELGICTILIHPHCSILSAFGIQLSDQSITRAKTLLEPLSEHNLMMVKDWHFNAVNDLRRILRSESTAQPTVSLDVELRYAGTQSAIEIPVADNTNAAELRAEFEERHQQQFGYIQGHRELELLAIRATATVVGNRLEPMKMQKDIREIRASSYQAVQSAAGELQYACFAWSELRAGDVVVGPAIIANDTTTVVVDPDWHVVVEANASLRMTKIAAKPAVKHSPGGDSVADPVQLEIFNRSFQSIASQMGDSLRKTSVSVNVKERLDYSCAIFCDRGKLVANAPHIPVHLGAMSESVRATMQLNPNICRGDVFVTNDPFQGGSHLPDVTVITPVFIDADKPAFWVASRSHHAEIGGMTPGSMPTDATSLEQEGVLIQNLKLVAAGKERFCVLSSTLSEAKYPSRNPSENLDDVRAQVAANQTGLSAILALKERFGWPQLSAYMRHIRAAAESKARQAIRKLNDGLCQFEDAMDDGTMIRVSIKKRQDTLEFDFTGTDPVHPGNLNANYSIVRSAVMYVLRCLVAEDIPLNEGLLNPVTIQLPDCFLNPSPGLTAATTPAVVGGNVETSQRVVDVLMGALGLASASQGTMNNWLIGDETFGYYETVGGGSGATSGGPGADAVHCHMSNTRLTDPEVLESRLPVILREFAIRESSGGLGVFAGGNGMIRRVEFRAPLILSLLTSRRTRRPFGLNGGSPGCSGENWLIREGEQRTQLPSSCRREVVSGDILELLTPGGGGYGS